MTSKKVGPAAAAGAGAATEQRPEHQRLAQYQSHTRRLAFFSLVDA
jgi:hypothetical protein